MLQTIVRKNQYQDSVALMVLSRTLSDLDGVAKVSVMMGTPANKQILADTGFSTPELDDAAPSDLVIGVDADAQGPIALGLGHGGGGGSPGHGGGHGGEQQGGGLAHV